MKINIPFLIYDFTIYDLRLLSGQIANRNREINKYSLNHDKIKTGKQGGL